MVTSLTASLSSLSSFITVNNPAGVSITSLNQNQQQGALFSITIDPGTPVGTVVDFSFYITDGMYTYNTSFSEIVGLQDEDYETGNFNQYTWVIDPDFPWTIDSSSVYEGTYSTRSAYNLPDGEESELLVVVDVVTAGDISFFKFVSSEQDYDFLKFKINGTKLAEWSGIDANWSFVSFPVTSVGQTTFKWEYEKDGSTISGDDCAWIDYIVFPPLYTIPSVVKEDIFSLELSPNPTMGSFYTSLSDNREHTMQILDSKGRILTKEKKVQSSFSFDISNYPAGTYYLKILPEQIIYPIIKQ